MQEFVEKGVESFLGSAQSRTLLSRIPGGNLVTASLITGMLYQYGPDIFNFALNTAKKTVGFVFGFGRKKAEPKKPEPKEEPVDDEDTRPALGKRLDVTDMQDQMSELTDQVTALTRAVSKLAGSQAYAGNQPLPRQGADRMRI